MKHFKIAKKHYDSLTKHLFPGDGKESVSIAICGRANNGNTFLVHDLIHIPHNLCEREFDFIKWPTHLIIDRLPEMVAKNFALFKVHSHPGGYEQFSELDDNSDLELFDSIYGWFDNEDFHGSLILLPSGNLIGRVITPELEFEEMDKITIVNHTIKISQKKKQSFDDSLNLRNRQTLGKGTQMLLKNMTIGVVGCSGTGSPVIEQLSRLGAGKLILVDPDVIESKNLNRIINSKEVDAVESTLKVDVAKHAIDQMGFSTEVVAYANNLYDDVSVIHDLSSCDFLFGCMDSVDGRHLLNSIASFYIIPYIDVGVKVISDKEGGIDQICGSIHYLQPGASSLLTRGVYTSEDLRAANMLRTDLEEYEKQKDSGYITDINVEAPAVISINMLASSLAVNEFLSRIHPIKTEELSLYDIIRFSLTDYYLMNEHSEHDNDIYLDKYIGRGDISPLLNIPTFTNYAKAI
ncbi:ThiF family adenylyltransferase [uncultured Croceitalea sp.]|uniref:ThiF family adenylyltransferase n=1 Tax=uncultured Croceitalea sp. TaxID=1798908 RepID=UPI0033059F1F